MKRELKSSVFQVFMTEADRRRIEDLALERGLSVSSLCRSLILEGLARLEAVNTAVREFEA